MPFSLSLVSFLNSICWTLYALIRFDIYITVSRRHPVSPGLSIPASEQPLTALLLLGHSPFGLFSSQIPNGLGTLLSLAQLVLYATYYYSSAPPKDEPKPDLQLPIATVAPRNDNAIPSISTR